MRFRTATAEDIPVLAELRWAFRTEEEPVPDGVTREEFVQACESFLREGMANSTWTVWVAEESGQIVANMYVQQIRKVPRPARFEDYIGYVTSVYTRPEYRNRGVGSELLRHLQEWASRRGIETLILWPSERSVPFYERAGFESENEVLEYQVRDEV